MSISLRVLVFIASLVGLIKSSDYFTKYSEKIGIMFGMSSFIIGATIVALGTSLPELISGIYAVLGGGLPEYVIDGAVGSNIANILLVFSIGAIYAGGLKVKSQLIDVDLPFFFVSMALFLFFARDQSISSREAIFLIAFIVIFIAYSVQSGQEEAAEESLEGETIKEEKSRKNILTYTLIIIVSMAALALSAKYFIDSILHISEHFGVTSSILTLSVVALGTSLPEVLTSLIAIKKGNHAIALGNVFGSNTFNLTLITGVPAFFGEVIVSDFTLNSGFTFLVIATMAAIFMTMDDKLHKREGIALMLLYVVFMARLIGFI